MLPEDTLKKHLKTPILGATFLVAGERRVEREGRRPSFKRAV